MLMVVEAEVVISSGNIAPHLNFKKLGSMLIQLTFTLIKTIFLKKQQFFIQNSWHLQLKAVNYFWKKLHCNKLDK